jgi:hypothetical protein
VIALVYRLMSTVPAGVAWVSWGIATGEVVATIDPKPPLPARLIAFEATPGEAANDAGMGASLVG